MNGYDTRTPKLDTYGTWIPQFDRGEEAIVAGPNSSSSHSHQFAIGTHPWRIGEVVTLGRYDPDDDSWEIDDSDEWIFQDCLSPATPVSDEDVEDAIASIKMGMHPDLIRMLAYEEEAIAQGYKEGDVNHYVQPVIGLLRLKLDMGELPDKEFLEYAVDRLLKACKAETAWLKKMERER